MDVQLVVSPQECLVDEQLTIKVLGFKKTKERERKQPTSKVITIVQYDENSVKQIYQERVEERGEREREERERGEREERERGEMVRVEVMLVDHKEREWVSWADFLPSSSGEIDLTKHAPSRGCYHGVHPMGLFFSLTPGKKEDQLSRLLPRPTFDYRYRIRAYKVPKECSRPTHKKEDKNLADYERLCCNSCPFPSTDISLLAPEVYVCRRYMDPRVERIEIEKDGLFGTLFLPPDFKNSKEKTFPGVIDLFGSGGGLFEHRAALLASRGVVTFALAYFRYKSLPKEVNPIRLDYFEKAARFLNSLPMVSPGGVGVVGTSLGACIVLALACKLPPKLLSWVFAIGASSSFLYRVLYHSKPAFPESVMSPGSFVQGSVRGVETVTSAYKPETTIILSETTCPITIISGDDDQNWPSRESADEMARLAIVDRKKENKDGPEIRHLVYHEAGHLIEPPHAPLFPAGFHAVVQLFVDMGGRTMGQAYAQEAAWKTLLEMCHQKPSQIKSNL